MKQLANSGPVPGADTAPPEENGVTKRDKRKNDGEERVKKKSRSERAVVSPKSPHILRSSNMINDSSTWRN